MGAVRAEMRVEGLVQGVNFRWYARAMAVELGVRGWVRNLPDGSVEVVAEGERSAVERFAEWCHHGPRGAQVERVEVVWKECAGDLGDFQIRL